MIIWLVGGQESAFNPRGAFADSPVHRECGMYALQVCPYLAMTKYSTKPTDLEKLSQKIADNVQLVNITQDYNRLPFFVFAKISGFKYNFFTTNVIPFRPYLELEFWVDGKKVSQKEIQQFLKYNPQDYI